MPNSSIQNENSSTFIIDLFTESIMLRTAGTQVLVFVEGDSDRRLYEHLFERHVSVIVASNWNAVEGIVEKYEAHSNKDEIPKILGIIDRDYRIAVGEFKNSTNLIYTHFRDIECEMIASEAFENLISEVSSEKFKKKWRTINEFRNAVLQMSASIGKLRFYSHVSKSYLCFQDLKYEKFCDFKLLNVDPKKLLGHVRGKQEDVSKIENVPKNFQAIDDALPNEKFSKHMSVYRLSRGHDVFGLISCYLKDGYAKGSVDKSVYTLEMAIRIAFKPIMRSSPTVNKIISWFDNNDSCCLIKP